MENKNINIDGFKNFLLKVKEKIIEIEPEAELYLFGSRARGDFNDDSDWDFLIILPGIITFSRRYAITKNTNQFEFVENIFFNRIYYSKDEWYNDKFVQLTPFYKNVLKDAIKL